MSKETLPPTKLQSPATVTTLIALSLHCGKCALIAVQEEMWQNQDGLQT